MGLQRLSGTLNDMMPNKYTHLFTGPLSQPHCVKLQKINKFKVEYLLYLHKLNGGATVVTVLICDYYHSVLGRLLWKCNSLQVTLFKKTSNYIISGPLY